MSGRGHRATLPPVDYRAKSPVGPDGLIVTVVNKDGASQKFDFAELPGTEPLQRSMAALFARQSRHWSSLNSARTYWRACTVFARFLSGLDHPPGDLDELTPAVLKRWRAQQVATNGGRNWMSMVRALLRHDPRLSAGLVAEELARRIPEQTPSKKSFTEAERDQVLDAARRQFRAAWLRVRENTEMLERWRAGQVPEDTEQWRLGRILDYLARTGDVPRTAGRVANRGVLGGTRTEQTWGRLFLTRGEVTALAVLLTDKFAWNLAAYNRMPAPTALPSVGERAAITYQVSVEKRRAGQGRWYSTENITDAGADSDGRLITQALQATRHGRALAARLAPGTDLLMTARSHNGRPSKDPETPPKVGPLAFGVGQDSVKLWVHSHGLAGSPFQRTRRTTITREGRPLAHSSGTHASVYVLPDEHVQRASRDVFADGASAAFDAALATAFAGHLTDVADAAHQPTATADCSDPGTSPWPGTDGGCAADFLLCLACRNAHVHPGHHPRLAHLHRQVLSLRSAVTDQTWQRRWSDHFLRLEDLRRKVGESAWNGALARVSDTDQSVVSLLLDGELTP